MNYLGIRLFRAAISNESFERLPASVSVTKVVWFL
jgi:hypothetical protein